MTGGAGRRPSANLFACAPRLVPFCVSTRRKSGVVEGLLGRRIPPVVLQECCCSPLNLGEFASLFSLVLYVYAGSRGSVDGEDEPGMDGIQHRAFRDVGRELSALGFQAIGVSSQSGRAQRQAVLANRLGHRLLSDPELLLARDLGLPTFHADGAWWYQRLVLVITGGRVAYAFSVCDPARSPAQAITWILIHSDAPRAGVDAS